MIYRVLHTFCLLLFSLSGITQQRPNIVLIMADDLGGRDLPVYGNKFNEAPEIIKLREEGMLFTQAYAAPVCSPTRASIQSGQYPARVGIFDFIPGHWRPFEEVTVPHHEVQHLPDPIFTLGDMMKKAGYRTGYFGKWHLGNGPDHMPGSRGYDEAYVYAGGLNFQTRFLPEYKNSNNKNVSEILTEMGVDFIKESKDQPFFLFVSHFDVHVQLTAESDKVEKFLEKEKDPDYTSNAVYAAMIEHLDSSVGRIMDVLEESGIEENTVVIFYSDNGGLDNRFDNASILGPKNNNVYPEGHPLRYVATSNAPLRGGKGTLFEGGIRVPLIVKWPGKIDPGSTSDAIVSSVDFYPTFIALSKGEKPENQILDGFSMLPALTGKEYDIHREVFTHYPVYHHEQPMSALRKGDWKIIENLVSGEFYLYNLKYDVSELTDLKYSVPDRLQEMKKLLQKWQISTNAKMPTFNPDFDASKRNEWGRNPHRD